MRNHSHLATVLAVLRASSTPNWAGLLVPDRACTARDHRAPNRRHDLSPGATSCGVRGGRRRARLAVGALAVTFASLVAGTASTAPSAYADVSSAQYTIGTPTNSVGSVVASPSTMVATATTVFELKFMATGPLSSTAGSTVTITPSNSLGTAPTNVSLIDDAETECFQSGTGRAPTAQPG